MKLTRDSLNVSEMVDYLNGDGSMFVRLSLALSGDQTGYTGSVTISGVHVDSKNQKMWVTLGAESRYREVSITFSDWVE